MIGIAPRYAAAMPHLAPVPLEQVEAQDIRERFEHYKRTRGFTPNSIMTMVPASRDRGAHFMALNQAVLYEGTVPHETKMLVSLASSLASGCLYCQSHMANLSSIYQACERKDRRPGGFRVTALCSRPPRGRRSVSGSRPAVSPTKHRPRTSTT
jgi:hypothetical protein